MGKYKTILRRTAIAAIAVVAICAAGVLWLRHENLADVAESGKASLVVTSADFADGGRIPEKFACDAGVSPALAWSQPPTGTSSIAIIMEDPDAPFGFIHWVVYGLSSDTRALPEGASSQTLPGNARVGGNGYGGNGYVGPCPPFGSHHYVFRVYAVDSNIELPKGATKEQLVAAMNGTCWRKGS